MSAALMVPARDITRLAQKKNCWSVFASEMVKNNMPHRQNTKQTLKVSKRFQLGPFDGLLGALGIG